MEEYLNNFLHKFIYCGNIFNNCFYDEDYYSPNTSNTLNEIKKVFDESKSKDEIKKVENKGENELRKRKNNKKDNIDDDYIIIKSE